MLDLNQKLFHQHSIYWYHIVELRVKAKTVGHEMLIVDVIIDHHIVKDNNVSQVWLPNIPNLIFK